jgi:hypothetical protein
LAIACLLEKTNVAQTVFFPGEPGAENQSRVESPVEDRGAG